MGDDREKAEARSEEGLAYLRHMKFGHLPARVRPEDLVETEEAEPMHEEPVQPMVRREWA